MRKFLIFLLIALLLLATQINGFLVATKDFEGSYSVYAEDEEIQNEYSLNFYQAMIKRLKTSEVKGESVRFLGKDEDIDNVIEKLDIRIVEEQNLADIRTIYGYSPRLGRHIIIDGKKVNVQIAKRGATITVGTPTILGSY